MEGEGAMSRPLPQLGEFEVMLPQAMQVAPSNMPVWRATRGVDQIFSWSQIVAAEAHGLDPDTCEFLIVRSLTTYREWYAGMNRPQPTLVLPCPIISFSDDHRRVLVIAPAGMKKWVNADGSIVERKPQPERQTRSHWRRKP
jgi:hypothetical protein